jgi:hypothetical protein
MPETWRDYPDAYAVRVHFLLSHYTYDSEIKSSHFNAEAQMTESISQVKLTVRVCCRRTYMVLTVETALVASGGQRRFSRNGALRPPSPVSFQSRSSRLPSRQMESQRQMEGLQVTACHHWSISHR